MVVSSSSPSSPRNTSARRPAPGEHLGHHRRHPRVGTADRAGDRLGRVGQRAEEVDDRGYAQLAARTGGVPEAGWNTGAKQNPMPTSATQRGDAVGRQVDGHAERLEHVGRAARGRRRAVAVLDDRRSRRGDDDGGHRRDVDRVRLVAAGADDVDGRSRNDDAPGVPQHRLGQPGDLRGGLALGPQRHGEAGELRGRGLAGHEPGPSPRRCRPRRGARRASSRLSRRRPGRERVSLSHGSQRRTTRPPTRRSRSATVSAAVSGSSG